MTGRGRRLWVVTYDIRDRKRWRRVFRLMEKRGAHRQLSVFLVKADARGIRRLTADLARLIDPLADSVLIAPVDGGTAGDWQSLGLPGPVPGAKVVIA